MRRGGGARCWPSVLALPAVMFVRIVGPVRRLELASQRIAGGDASHRVARGGIRELDALAAAFNRMAADLDAAQAVAREYQQRLEATVAERTRQLLHLAAHDPLTELPNRRELFARLSAAVARARAAGSIVGVFVLDVANFKNLIDSVGHAYGDRVLQAVAQRLTETTGTQGWSARLGGDEVTVIVEDMRDVDALNAEGRHLVRAFQAPIGVDGRDLVLSISVGASCCPAHGDDAESLLRAADAALFRAKALGRSQSSVFTPDLLAAAATRFSTEQGLRLAIERGELELVFQPEIDAATLEVGLVEALLRWRLPDGRLASPGEFLAVAEEPGLILDIGDWVLATALQTVAAWRRGPWPGARVAINVSVRQLIDHGFEARLLELLAAHELPPHCVEIELTENALQTGRATVEAVGRLRAAGVGIALDDFGTGYSSLASIEQLPLTRVKLDRSLVTTIDTNPRALAITRAIAALCEQLGLEMTAEGIERPEQLQLLLVHHAICLQGYLLSRPVDEAALPARVRELPARVASVLQPGAVREREGDGWSLTSDLACGLPAAVT
jgi:diguanylate cyclase (GGDEF)-like protein